MRYGGFQGYRLGQQACPGPSLVSLRTKWGVCMQNFITHTDSMTNGWCSPLRAHVWQKSTIVKILTLHTHTSHCWLLKDLLNWELRIVSQKFKLVQTWDWALKVPNFQQVLGFDGSFRLNSEFLLILKVPWQIMLSKINIFCSPHKIKPQSSQLITKIFCK